MNYLIKKHNGSSERINVQHKTPNTVKINITVYDSEGYQVAHKNNSDTMRKSEWYNRLNWLKDQGAKEVKQTS